MGIITFFKLATPRKFNYKPLYFDPVKDRIAERNKEIAREMGLEKDEAYVSRIRPGIFREHSKKAHKVKSSSNIRLIVILIILLFLAYLIFYR